MTLTLDEFSKQTGRRFRVTTEQAARIEAGTLTREVAFQEFLAAGGLEKVIPRKQQIPDEFYLQEGLTADNFSERLLAQTGIVRRFRISKDKAGLTRDQALQEIIAAKKAAAVNTGNQV